jgi:hypothetical protein
MLTKKFACRLYRAASGLLLSGPRNIHRIVAQISGMTPNPKNTGVYEK